MVRTRCQTEKIALYISPYPLPLPNRFNRGAGSPQLHSRVTQESKISAMPERSFPSREPIYSRSNGIVYPRKAPSMNTPRGHLYPPHTPYITKQRKASDAPGTGECIRRSPLFPKRADHDRFKRHQNRVSRATLSQTSTRGHLKRLCTRPTGMPQTRHAQRTSPGGQCTSSRPSLALFRSKLSTEA